MKGYRWSKLREIFALGRVKISPGLGVIALIAIARLTGSLQFLEWMVFDLFLRLRPAEPKDERIVIVGINEADIQRINQYPIPDREIAELLDSLQQYNPRVIGLHLVRDIPFEPGHQQLLATWQNLENLIVIEKAFPPEVIAHPPEFPPKKIGFADRILDGDTHLRRILLGAFSEDGEEYKFAFSIRLAEAYLATEVDNGLRDVEAMRFRDTELPRLRPNSGGYVRTDANGVQMLLNFRSGKDPFTILSLSDIKQGNFAPTLLQDRLVIIGLTASSVKDTIQTFAVSSGQLPGLVSGVEIQAHAVSQMIGAVVDERVLLQVWWDGWEYIWILAWGIWGMGLSYFKLAPFWKFLALGASGIILLGGSYTLLIGGWWIPVVPTLLALTINGMGYTIFNEYDKALRSRLEARQQAIEHTFDAIHNGPLQTLASILRQTRDEKLPPQQFILELEQLNQEIRNLGEHLKQQALDEEDSLLLSGGTSLDLKLPIHELFYQVYNSTLERNFSGWETLKFKTGSFAPLDERYLNKKQKRKLCQFLEEALCNVGKHARGMTRLSATGVQKKGWYILCITDNGAGLCSSHQGRGTKQCLSLARELNGNFKREGRTPRGTLCELTWPIYNLAWW